MRKFTPETAIAAIELQQMVIDFLHEIDVNEGRDITDFYAEDGTFLLGDYTYRGHAAIGNFYKDRAERVRSQLKDGARTSRHSFTNLRISIEDGNRADLRFCNVQFSGEGKAPVRDFDGPTMVVDCRMACRCDTDGQWRIAEFQGSPTFVGKDPFLNKMLIKS